jgi:Serine dehydrogenase proteinase
MPYADRVKLIEEIERLRNSKVVSYLTTIRPNSVAQMAEDAVREMFDHLLLLPSRPVKQLDVFLCSNGGSGTVPWRLVSLFREFAEKVAVLIPYRAYSAATMLALGADEIVMGPFAEMGPIDPTVTNEYNPVDPATQQRIGISVEDVKAYVAFVKDTVGIRHEDELIKAIEILAQKVHPLALGNVERFISQSRMIARKILLTHMAEEPSKHEIDEIIDTLASKLYFHGHPINRREARDELKLKVSPNVPPELETAMWKLYLDYEAELQNKITFDPMADIYRAVPDYQPGQPGAIIPPGTSTTSVLRLAIVESARLTSAFDQERRLVVAALGPQGEPMMRAETLRLEWRQERAPEPAPAE